MTMLSANVGGACESQIDFECMEILIQWNGGFPEVQGLCNRSNGVSKSPKVEAVD